MKVWVVTYGFSYEHEYTLGVYSTYRKALKAIKDFKVSCEDCYDYYHNNCYDIDVTIKY